MDIILSKRLAVLARCIPTGCTVADIGTDHAHLPVYLVEAGICPRVIATDVNDGPLATARQAVQKYGLEGSIELRRGDGLQVIAPGEVEVVVLAGMGGRLIAGILGTGIDVVQQLKRLVLQPNTQVAFLRAWLVENGWGIVDEHLVEEDGKLYPVLVAEQGRGLFPRDKFSREIGPCLLEKGGEELLKLLFRKKRQYEKIRAGLSRGKGSEIKEKRKEIDMMLEKIKEVLARAGESQRFDSLY